MKILRYAVAGLFLFASWANHTRLFGIRGGDLVTLILAVLGLSVLATLFKIIPEKKQPEEKEADPGSRQPAPGNDEDAVS